VTHHPSHLVIDRVAIGGEVPAEVARHLETCEACAATVAARRSAEPLPAWAGSLRVAPAPAPSLPGHRHAATTPRLPRWWLLPLPAALALSVAIVLLRGESQSGPALDDAIREKGSPAVVVYVKRGDAVVTWDGRSPVRPDDRLRLGIRGGGFANLSVASLQPGFAPAVLYAGPLEPRGETLLPLSFLVDAAGGAEELSVILSQRPVDAAVHARAASPPAPPGLWTELVHIPKDPTP
jgi:hypothetical protein